MSHKAYVGILAHHEPRSARPTSSIPSDQADNLVAQLVCERISQTKIRMLAPSSVFMTIQREPIAAAASVVTASVPTSLHLNYLATAEIPGLRFQPPEKDRYTIHLRTASMRREWERWREELNPVPEQQRTPTCPETLGTACIP